MISLVNEFYPSRNIRETVLVRRITLQEQAA